MSYTKPKQFIQSKSGEESSLGSARSDFERDDDDQKDPLKFHPNEVARFAKDILRIKEVTVEVFNTPSSAAQNILVQILDELKSIRSVSYTHLTLPTMDSV